MGADTSWGLPAFCDLDADGDLDYVLANGSYGNQIWLNDGTGTFTQYDENFGSTSQKIYLVDLDNDDDLDILATNLSRSTEIFLNDGEAKFSPCGTMVGKKGVISILIVDVDNNELMDIVTGTIMGSGGNKVYLNKGYAE